MAFKLAVTNLWRNKLLSFATIFVISSILFIFNIIAALNFLAEDSLEEINNKIDINITLKPETSLDQAQIILNQIEKQPTVESAKLISKQEALREIQANNESLTLNLEELNLQNPLPNSIRIKTKKPTDNKDLLEYLNLSDFKIYLETEDNDKKNQIISSVSENLNKISQFSSQIIFWLILIFLVGGSLIILNALQVTIFSRRKEIKIMRLVGASHWFIRLPFLIEALIFAVLSMIISYTLLFVIGSQIVLTDVNLAKYAGQFLTIFFSELAITTLLCIVSSSIATHEYLSK
jgi:cell division transport system permease protein